MPKNKKRYKIKKQPQTPDNQDNSGGGGFFSNRKKPDRTPEEIREYLKLFLLLITWIIFLSGVYMVCLQLEFELILPIYLILGVVLFFVWLIYNGGFRKFDLSKIEKPEETSYEEFTAFVHKLRERQKRAKYFLILFMPFFIIMLADYTIMVWGERIFN